MTLKINSTVISLKEWKDHALKVGTTGQVIELDSEEICVCWYYTQPRYSGNAAVVLTHPSWHYGQIFEKAIR